MQYEVREYDVGGVLDQGIKLTRNHFKLLFGIACVVYIPAYLLSNVMVLLAGPTTYLQGGTETNGWMIAYGIVMVFVLLLALPFTNAAIIIAVAREYLDAPVGVGQAFRGAFRRLLPLIWTNILKGCLLIIGYAACVVPGILLTFLFYFSNHAVVLENRSGPDALRRSATLMKGHWGVAIVLGLLIWVISMAVNMLAQLLTGTLLTALVSPLLQGALVVFSLAALVVFYFSARCRHEQFDLQLLAETVNAGARPDVLADADAEPEA